MTSFHADFGSAASGPAKGAWRLMLRTRLLGRAEPLFIGTSGLRSAASLWSGAQVWTELLRLHPGSAPVVVWQAERLALLQLLVAVLWDGRTLQVEPLSRTPLPGAWCLDGRQLAYDGQAVCRLGDGGWPDLPGPARMSIRDMLVVAPAHGDIQVGGRQASHGDLWLALGAPLGRPLSACPTAAVPKTEVLSHFDLATLATPHDVLNDALMPLLRCPEVWEDAALPMATAPGRDCQPGA